MYNLARPDSTCVDFPLSFIQAACSTWKRMLSIFTRISASLSWMSWNEEMGLPNCSASDGVLERREVAVLGLPEGLIGNGDALKLEVLHELHEAVVLFAEDIRLLHFDVVEVPPRRSEPTCCRFSAWGSS